MKGSSLFGLYVESNRIGIGNELTKSSLNKFTL